MNPGRGEGERAGGEPPAARQGRFTPSGIWALWLGIMILLVGIVRIDDTLLIFGLGWILILLAARAWSLRQSSEVYLRRRLPEMAFAADTVTVPLIVENRAPSLTAVDLRLSFAERVSRREEVTLARLPARSQVSLEVALRVPPRGRQIGGAWTVTSGHPGGFYEVARQRRFRDEWLVFPTPILPREMEDMLARMKMEQLLQWRLEHEVSGEIRGVREYQPGDALKAIHWTASARASKLMTREWDPPQPMPGRLGLLLHGFSPRRQVIRPEAFEAMLRAACGLVDYCRREAIPLRFMAAFDDWEPLLIPDRAGYVEVFKRLALAERQGESELVSLDAALARARDCDRVFVMGDAPLESWEPLLPASEVPLVCSSGETGEARRARLKVRRAVRVARVKPDESVRRPAEKGATK